MRRHTSLRGAAVAGLLNSIGSMLAVAIFGRSLIATAGVDSYGAWGVVAFLATFPSLLDLGFARQTVQRIVSTSHAEERATYVANLLAYTVLTALVSIAVASTFLLIGPARHSGLDPRLMMALGVSSILSIVGSALLSFVRTVAEVSRRLPVVAYSFLAQTVLAYVLAALSVRTVPRSSLLYYSYPAALALVLTGLIPIAVASLREIGVSAAPSGRLMLRTFRDGLGHGLAGALSFAVLPLNRGFILHQGGNLALYGMFDVVTRMCEAAAAVLTSAFTPLYRHFLDPLPLAEKRRVVRRSEAFVLAVFAGGVALYAILARPILRYLLNEDIGTFVVVAVLALALRASHAVAEPSTRLLWAHDNKRIVLHARLAALLLNVILLWSLAEKLPLGWAAGLGYSIPYAISAAIIVIGARHSLPEFGRISAVPSVRPPARVSTNLYG